MGKYIMFLSLLGLFAFTETGEVSVCLVCLCALFGLGYTLTVGRCFSFPSFFSLGELCILDGCATASAMIVDDIASVWHRSAQLP
ncbi:hypothetical protein B0T18DRAFT_422160 [Schizothecium vesticola]|uniref:Secreted protein n=1 Tax=Schizothecium vesticola TaxID=314040 RepID=A0AA40EH70_9PEZI|nr:hypothetical protein B0T18DRAFT_422160 [Schizothecium vesticola]